jgi:hypothetical protein
MKILRFLLPSLFIAALLLTSGCKDEETIPCDGIGNICFTNKLDSTVVIDVLQLNLQISIPRDHMECLELTGDVAYNFKLTCNEFYKDTTIVVSTCDNDEYIITR